MGTFASNFHAKGAHIPEEKQPEFEGRLEKLFQAGGMMEIERISMFGIKADILRKAQMHERGMSFFYNYFEEDSWENAGYNPKKKRVWSGKIGWSEFCTTVCAAYVLENLYSDGVEAAFVNGEMLCEENYTGWINYLFHENFCEKNRNPWKLFDVLSTEKGLDDEEFNFGWNWAVTNLEGMTGYTEIIAAERGSGYMLQWHDCLQKSACALFQNYEDKFYFFTIVRIIVEGIRAYPKESERPTDEQLRTLCDHIKVFYQESDLEFSDFVKRYVQNQAEKKLFIGLFSFNLPVVAIKTISEVYGKDFWELWAEFREVVYGTHRTFVIQPPEGLAARPIPTAEFFGRSADDMIYYWREGGDVYFSEEIENWFLSLKKRYDEIMIDAFTVDNPVRWMLELMNYAQEEYYHIFTFAEFFEESLEHLSERSYIALWKLYEEMLYDPKLEEAGSVIFVPDGPGHENEGLYYYPGQEPRRRLLRNWDITDKEKRENLARVTLRRYMALVANEELRKKVFGF
ncbi:MAG: hypothetical protein LUH53_07415 [Lachnospiraceae bacterium]|nr:hypothetical protein [Lachnospiraceae bacterium]